LFNGNRSLSALSLSYNAFADNVVCVLSKSSLFTRQLFEAAFGGLGLFGLQLLSEAAVSVSGIVDLRTGKGLTIGIGGNVDDTQVNPKHANRVKGVFRGEFTRGTKVELTINQNQIRFALLMGEQTGLIVTRQKGDGQPPVNCPDGNGIRLVSEDTAIIGNAAQRPEGSLSGLV
jgi:hypothetical protein